MIIKAIRRLNPNAKVVIRGDDLETAIIEWHDGNPTNITNQQILDAQAELKAEEPIRRLREQRNQKLIETDWRFRSDLTPSQAWKDYCLTLRDLPATAEPKLNENGQLTNVTWPEKPE